MGFSVIPESNTPAHILSSSDWCSENLSAARSSTQRASRHLPPTCSPVIRWLCVMCESSPFWVGKPLCILGKESKPRLVLTFLVAGLSLELDKIIVALMERERHFSAQEAECLGFHEAKETQLVPDECKESPTPCGKRALDMVRE